MSNRKNRRAQRDRNILRPSSIDTIQLGKAIEERFLNLMGSWLRVNKEELEIPKELDAAILGWRTMLVRHKQGDFRNSEEELQLVHMVAQWTVDQNCELRNQPPKKVRWAS